MEKLINITQLSKELNLINSKTNKPSNYILRYWEKEFKQIKPTIIRNRRYYTKKQINIIKLIKFLIKDQGITLKGVKKVLKSKINKLDDYDSNSLKTAYQKYIIKLKTKLILEKIKKIKKNG